MRKISQPIAPRCHSLTWLSALLLQSCALSSIASNSPADLGGLLELQQHAFENAAQNCVLSPLGQVEHAAPDVAARIPEIFADWLMLDAQQSLRNFASAKSTTLAGAEICAAAPLLTAAHLESGWRSPAAAAGMPRWFKIQGSQTQRLTLQAYANADDTLLAIYSNCNFEPSAQADDVVLLQARVSFTAKADSPYWIKLTSKFGAEASMSAMQTGQIQGNVSGTNLPTARIGAHLASGQLIASSNVVDGAYSLDLLPGSYYLFARSSANVSQAYSGIECPGTDFSSCNIAQATPLTISAGQTLSQINFQLTTGARISGRVISEETGAGVQAIVVAQQKTAFTDAAGRYSLSGLAAGSIEALAYANFNQSELPYLAQRFRDRNCPGIRPQDCAATSVDPFVLASNGFRSRVDFGLRRVSQISGQVQSGDSFANAQVELLNAAGQVVGGTNSFFAYRIFDIANGSYRVRFTLHSNLGTVRALYPNLICTQADCSDRLAEATVLQISSNSSTFSNINMNFPLSRKLFGRLVDRANGQNVSGTVFVKNSAGQISSVETGTGGDFQFFGLSPGPITLFARSETHIDAYYPNIDCQIPTQSNCLPTQSTLVSITIPQSGDIEANFNLQRGARVSGGFFRTSGVAHSFAAIPILETLAGLPVPATQVFSSTSAFVLIDIPAGSYRLRYPEDGGFFATARELTFAPAQVLSNFDMVLLPKRGFEGRIVNQSGAGIGGVAVDFWLGTAHAGAAQSDAQGWYWFEPSGGQFELAISTDAPAIYTNQVHSNIACPLGPVFAGLCGLGGAKRIAIPATAPGQHRVDFQLLPAAATDRIFFSDFENGLRRTMD